jgi:hypothetical protein
MPRPELLLFIVTAVGRGLLFDALEGLTGGGEVEETVLAAGNKEEDGGATGAR